MLNVNNLDSSDKEDNLQDFNELFFNYGKKLFVYSYGMVGNEKEAEEMVQEIFLQIWEQQLFMDKALNIDSHIFEIAKHIIYSRIRKKILNAPFKEHII